MKTYKIVISILALSVLVACGGGNSRPATITPNKPNPNQTDKPNQPDKPKQPDKPDKPNKPDKPYETLPPTVVPSIQPTTPWEPIDTVDSDGQKLAIYHTTSLLKYPEDKDSTWYSGFKGGVKYKQKNFNAKQQYIYMMDNGQKINIADLSDVSPPDRYDYKLNKLYAHNDPQLYEQFINEHKKYLGSKISTALSYARFGIIQTRLRGDLFVQGQETPITAIPLSGTVKYQGDTITIGSPLLNQYGTIELTADFGSKKITGSYQEFNTNGQIFNIAADIKGNTFSGEHQEVQTFNGLSHTYIHTTQGSFFGPNAEEVAGIIEERGIHTVFGAKQVK